MDDPVNDQHLTSPSRGRVPTAAQASTLHSRVEAVLRVLHAARADAERNSVLARERLIEKYGPLLERAMFALGAALADFIYEPGPPADLNSLRVDFLEPILSLSRSLPMYRWSEEWRQTGRGLEFARMALEGRRASYDLESLLLEEYYQTTMGMQALRVRADALAKLLRDEGRRLRGPEERELHVLVLGANTVLSLPTPSGRHPVDLRVSLLIVDGDTQALRHARQHVETAFGLPPEVLRVQPDALAKTKSQIHGRFDIICSLTQYDRLSPEAALDLTRGLAEILKPGGALITGSYFPGVPAPARALVAAMVEVYWRHWDEAMWREMLGQLPFDLSNSRFEVIPPATITVLARRR